MSEGLKAPKKFKSSPFITKGKIENNIDEIRCF
jgi:hypothetical protein